MQWGAYSTTVTALDESSFCATVSVNAPGFELTLVWNEPEGVWLSMETAEFAKKLEG
jgi:hypothetical protein